jgi:hypothetical protein
MKVRTLLLTTAFVSAILGGSAVYLALTVPNDLKADSMLKTARKDLEEGKRETARDDLSKIVQQYPRTDAAAAATVALMRLSEQEQKDLRAEIARVRSETEKHTEALTALQQTVDGIRNAPPKVVVIQAPSPAPPAKSAVKKPAGKSSKKNTTRRQRSRR